jgi:hypothetical protein
VALDCFAALAMTDGWFVAQKKTPKPDKSGFGAKHAQR